MINAKDQTCVRWVHHVMKGSLTVALVSRIPSWIWSRSNWIYTIFNILRYPNLLYHMQWNSFKKIFSLLVTAWSTTSRFTSNSAKRTLLRFHPRSPLHNITYTSDNSVTTCNQSHRYLGVIISNSLELPFHYDVLTSRVCKMLGLCVIYSRVPAPFKPKWSCTWP